MSKNVKTCKKVVNFVKKFRKRGKILHRFYIRMVLILHFYFTIEVSHDIKILQ